MRRKGAEALEALAAVETVEPVLEAASA